jgi:hypothetical protein
MKANRYTIEPGANLYGANLYGANLQGADLQGADLRRAYLEGANLRYANLRYADLEGANLSGADLQGAILEGAYLRGADLRNANLRVASLRGADLQGADLQGAILEGAYLRDAYLRNANLQGANLRGAELNPERCPCTGSFRAWKQVNDGRNIRVIEVEVPADARRTNGIGSYKCRAEYVRVITPDVDLLHRHRHDGGKTRYATGEVVRANHYCDDRRLECAPGIYFYLTKAECS